MDTRKSQQTAIYALVAALVLCAFVIGWLARGGSSPDPERADAIEAHRALVKGSETILDSLRDSADRTRQQDVEYRNAPPGTVKGGSQDSPPNTLAPR